VDDSPLREPTWIDMINKIIGRLSHLLDFAHGFKQGKGCCGMSDFDYEM
jgi:hypothetical protein